MAPTFAEAMHGRKRSQNSPELIRIESRLLRDLVDVQAFGLVEEKICDLGLGDDLKTRSFFELESVSSCW